MGAKVRKAIPRGVSQQGHLSEDLRMSLMMEKDRIGGRAMGSAFKATVDGDQDGLQSSKFSLSFSK